MKGLPFVGRTLLHGPLGVALAWAASAGAVSMLTLRLWWLNGFTSADSYSRFRVGGWVDHWASSPALTFAVGVPLGLALAALHLGLRSRWPRRGAAPAPRGPAGA
jgi:hypothetical protein